MDANESIAVVLDQAAKSAIKSCHNLCKTVDESYIDLCNTPEELSDEMYIMLSSIRDRFLLLDTLFETAIAKQVNINSNERDYDFKEVYQNYRITCGKFHRLVFLAKQIKVVPNYFKSDIEFQGLTALTEQTNRILSS